MTRLISLALGLSTFGGSVMAGGPGVFYEAPDYKQQRGGLPGPDCDKPPCLEDGGRLHCGAATAADVLKWLHDNGFPLFTWEDIPLLPFDDGCGREDLIDDEVTVFMRDLGIEMDSVDGTSTEDLIDGIQNRLDGPYSGQFTLGHVGRSQEYDHLQPFGGPQVQFGHDFRTVIAHLQAGRIPIVNVGWYRCTDGKRCGGHWMPVTGYNDVDPEHNEYEVLYNDPARKCNAGNAVPTPSKRDVTLEIKDLEDSDDIIRQRWASSWNWVRDPNDCSEGFKRLGVQCGVVYVAESCLFSIPGTFGATCFNLARSEGTSLPLSFAPTSIAVRPSLLELYAASETTGELHAYDLATHRSGPVTLPAALVHPRQLEFAANETLLVLDFINAAEGYVVYAFEPDGTLAGSVQRLSVTAIAYHEEHDVVYVWDGSAGLVEIFDTDLVPTGDTLQLPADRTFAEPAHLAPDPRGDVLHYNHAGSDAIFRYDVVMQGEVLPIESGALVDPTGMVFDNTGRLYVASAQPRPVITFVDGALEEVNPANNLLASGDLAITRASRRPLSEVYVDGHTNHDPPDEPSDLADVNDNGRVEFGDLLAILAAWGPCDECPEDIDGDGVVGFAEILLVLAAWAPGCP